MALGACFDRVSTASSFSTFFSNIGIEILVPEIELLCVKWHVQNLWSLGEIQKKIVNEIEQRACHIFKKHL